MGDNREDIRLSVLKVLEDAPHIMLEPLGQRRNILSRKERDQVHRLGRITPEQLNGLFSLEDSGDLVTREQDGHLASRGPKPVNKLPLGMRVRSIHFIQNKTHRHLVSSKEGRNTACVLAGLGQGLDVCKTAQLAGCVQFKKVEPTRLGSCEDKGSLPDTRRAVKKQALRVRWSLEIGLETGLDLCVSGDVLKDLGASGFAPHALSS